MKNEFFFCEFPLLEADTFVKCNKNSAAMLTWYECFSVLTLSFYFDVTVGNAGTIPREALVYPELFQASLSMAKV